uniref:G-type lectin S-receptor-like serine/threonine-protein kinase At4g27290 n=1 Tax=Erigeron canadensis TaxID=72917 RepID=UPI001CB9D446|nr:G-type lectin S-receptor-like serine/threonine-protein kinase At4g27290 [Erigeron canadensis]
MDCELLLAGKQFDCYVVIMDLVVAKEIVQEMETRFSALKNIDDLNVCATSQDTINANQTIKDGQTIVSAQQTFELGFFSPKNSTNRYVGIWYKTISYGTVMWVANRNTPLTNTLGELSLTLQGILVIRNASGDVIWSSSIGSSLVSLKKPVAQLLDTGNFIVRQETDHENYIWQSFDYTTDTLVPGMKFGKDLVTGLEWNFTSWKTENDPSLGKHCVRIDIQGYPQMMVLDGPNIRFRAGPWNGVRFAGEPSLSPNSIYKYGFVLNQREMYYHFDLINTSVVTRVVINHTGSFERLLWIESRQEWIVYMTPQTDNCDRYGLCGSFASCNINNSPACGCLKGFEPKSPDQWNVADWSQGCRRSTPLDCGPKEGFRKYSNIKLPDTRWSWFDQSMNLNECEQVCKRNCSCTAYTTQNISGSGSGCLLWFGDLMDIRTLTENGQDLYIRMPTSELAKNKSSSEKIVKIIVPLISVLLITILSICVLYRFKNRMSMIAGMEVIMYLTLTLESGTLEGGNKYDAGNENSNDDQQLPILIDSKDELELPILIDFSILQKATDNFSENNKLGEGGFGPVYKGVMENGKEIAVKRLSRSSNQGHDEFMNEVITISKLQHRNLVTLLGCCIKGAENMLVYEYMSNKSLDFFIFDENQSTVLDWPTRVHIIKGIARGLLYLHRDSRLRIIHRDLKVSNILLDHDMVPKISDFGIAKCFGGNQIEATTERVVGTYGYMAPEYAGDGMFSIKSDVFSFGVLVLEIVSGKRNRGFKNEEHSDNLIGHAWRLHKKGKSLKLVATSLYESINLSEVSRSIHLGLLCVQQRPEDRPTMASVVQMFSSDGELPPPKPPGFFHENATEDTIYTNSTIDELTVTMMEAR